MSKLRWLTSLLLLALAIPAMAAAQERTTITGTVTEAGGGQALRNAQVTVPAANVSVPTDANGRFTLQLRPGTHVIEVNMLGYKSVRRSITVTGAPQAVTFTLETDPLNLDELVVVGYGEERRRKVTGSVSSMRPEAVREAPVTSVNQIMQGRMPGVQITQNSGTPGSAITVRVRGSSSISGGNEPLYVVDGVPLNQGDFSYAGASSGGQDIDAVNDISPNEIERIEILKDASAAAIYGSRASNGVVLITTKRGTSGRAEINVGAYYGTQDFWKEVEFLNAQQYMDVYNEGLTNRFGPASLAANGGYDAYYCYEGAGNCETTVPAGLSTDWVGEVTDPAPISNLEGSIRGGTERVRYYVSGSMINQDGIVSVMGYERLSGRVNLDYQPFDRLTLVTNVALSRSVTDRGRNDDTIYGAFANATATPPIEPIYVDAEGNPCPSLTNCSYADNLYANPVGMLNEAQWEERAIRILGNAAANYNLMSGLDARFSVGLDQFTNRSRTYDSPNFGPWSGNGGMASAGNVFVNKVTVEGTVNFNRTLGEINEFSGVVGASYEDNTRERTYTQAEGFPSAEFKMIDSGARVTIGNGNLTEWGLASYFGRVSHTFNDKLTTTLNVRRDGSSRFGENNRWGTFPSIALLYRIGEESFMRSQNILGNLALRASYGRTGNQQLLGDFAARGLFGGGANYGGTPGIAPSQLANPDLKWETTDQLNLGADFSLLTDRVSLSFDWYNKKTNDLLFSLPLPSQTGFTSIWSNVGAMKNTGIELALRADLFRGGARGLNWTTALSFARNRNEVTELYKDQPVLGTNAIIVGEPLGAFYGYVADGIFQSIEEVKAHATQTVNSNPLRATAAGDIRFKDLNGDGVINASGDRQVIGSPWPEFEGGLTNTVSFRSLDLTAFVQFSQGNDVFNGNRIYQDQFGSGGDNHTTRALDRWSPTNTDAKYPRAVWGDPNVNTRTSSFFVEDGSYVRLKNVVLGFTLPTSLAEKGGFRSARVYVQGQNLLTKTKYDGWDPEVNVSGQVSVTRGYDFYTLPQARTITFGFNVGL